MYATTHTAAARELVGLSSLSLPSAQSYTPAHINVLLGAIQQLDRLILAGFHSATVPLMTIPSSVVALLDTGGCDDLLGHISALVDCRASINVPMRRLFLPLMDEYEVMCLKAAAADGRLQVLHASIVGHKELCRELNGCGRPRTQATCATDSE